MARNIDALLHELTEIDGEVRRHEHALSSVKSLLGGCVAVVARLEPAGAGWRWTTMVHTPLDESTLRLVSRPFADGESRLLSTQRILSSGASTRTQARRDLAGDREWYESWAFREVMHPAGLDDHLVSVRPFGRHVIERVAVLRPRGSRPFSQRECQLLSAFHRGFVFWGVPAARAQKVTARPREHAVLDQLLQGQSTKEISAALGVQYSTVAHTLTTLYRRHGVKTRAELLARYVDVPEAPATAMALLTGRQREILAGLCAGRREREISEDLGISVNTVHEYIKALHARFACSSRAELLVRLGCL